MTSEKHTPSPAPWTVEFDESYRVRDADGGSVAQLHFTGKGGKFGGRRDNEEVMANARLIAAAPALLEALKETLAIAQLFEKQASKGSGGRRGGPVFEKARALIAQSEGRQP